MKHEIVNKETPAMKQFIAGIREVNKRLRMIAKALRQLFGGETYFTGREVCELLFINPRTLQDYLDKDIILYTKNCRESAPSALRYQPITARKLSFYQFKKSRLEEKTDRLQQLNSRIY